MRKCECALPYSIYYSCAPPAVLAISSINRDHPTGQPGNKSMIEKLPGNKSMIEKLPGNKSMIEKLPGNKSMIEKLGNLCKGINLSCLSF